MGRPSTYTPEVIKPAYNIPHRYSRNLKQDKKIRFVYMMWATGTNRYKIGITNNLKRRLNDVNNSSPYKTEIIAWCLGFEKDEHDVQRLVESYHVWHEWYEMKPQEAVIVAKAMREVAAFDEAHSDQ